MPATLRVSDTLALPADAATESFGVLGQRGSGKSNVAVVFGEELWKAKVPWVAIDPKGDWWGLRSSADGNGPGLPIPVFGGLHGDLPLSPAKGTFVADLLVDQTLTAVLDVSRMTGGEMATFLTAFCHRLFDRHQADPHVRFVIFEEAHRYIPQQVTSTTAVLKEATAKIPLEGRAFGLGSLTASQRSSRLHKDVLTQVGTLIAMRSPAKLDRDAIGGWVEEHGVSQELLKSLPGLDDGEGWVWSPHFLKLVERVRFRRRETFDSGATPKVGQSKRTPKTLADVDVKAIEASMAETIEQAKANDPAELRRRIRDLERQLHSSQLNSQVNREVVREVERVEVPVLTDEQVRMVTEWWMAGERASLLFSEASENVAAELRRIQSVPMKGANGKAPRGVVRPPGLTDSRRRVAVSPQAAATPSVGPLAPAREPEGEGSTPVSAYGRRLLETLAQRHPLRLSRTQLGMLSRSSTRSSSFDGAIAQLRKAGLIVFFGGEYSLSEAGWDELGERPSEPATSEELIARWREALPNPSSQRVFDVLVAAYPHGLARLDIAERAGSSPTSSSFDGALSTLRKAQLTEAEGGLIRAAAVLFT